MDEHVQEENGRGNLEKKLAWIVAALAVAVVALLAFFLVARHENRANMQVINAEKEVLQQELLDLGARYDGLRASNDSLDGKLAIEREKIAGLLVEMKRFRSNSYAEINRYKEEVNTLKAIARGYVVQIDSLDRANRQLRAENREVRKQIDWVRERNKTLEEKTTRMEETLEQATALAVEDLALYPVNTRERVTAARKCSRLKAEFTLSRNIAARRGTRVIYLRVTRPDGKVIVDEGLAPFKHDNVELACTARREIVYEGERLEVSIYWPNDGSVGQGKYRADLFCDGRQIGTGEFFLK